VNEAAATIARRDFPEQGLGWFVGEL